MCFQDRFMSIHRKDGGWTTDFPCASFFNGWFCWHASFTNLASPNKFCSFTAISLFPFLRKFAASAENQSALGGCQHPACYPPRPLVPTDQLLGIDSSFSPAPCNTLIAPIFILISNLLHFIFLLQKLSCSTCHIHPLIPSLCHL